MAAKSPLLPYLLSLRPVPIPYSKPTAGMQHKAPLSSFAKTRNLIFIFFLNRIRTIMTSVTSSTSPQLQALGVSHRALFFTFLNIFFALVYPSLLGRMSEGTLSCSSGCIPRCLPAVLQCVPAECVPAAFQCVPAAFQCEPFYCVPSIPTICCPSTVLMSKKYCTVQVMQTFVASLSYCLSRCMYYCNPCI